MAAQRDKYQRDDETTLIAAMNGEGNADSKILLRAAPTCSLLCDPALRSRNWFGYAWRFVNCGFIYFD